MTINVAVLILGLFGIPVLLLVLGKRLRQRSSKVRKIFWGAIAGHLIAIIVATIAGLISPEGWSEADRLRGVAGYWALLILPLAGALIALIASRPASRPRRQE